MFPPLSINEYNDRVMKVVRCESQVCIDYSGSNDIIDTQMNVILMVV